MEMEGFPYAGIIINWVHFTIAEYVERMRSSYKVTQFWTTAIIINFLNNSIKSKNYYNIFDDVTGRPFSSVGGRCPQTLQ